MNEEKQEVYKILELGTDEKNLHKHKNTGGLLYIDLSMIKFSNLSTYIRKQDKEIKRLNNIIKEVRELVENGTDFKSIYFKKDKEDLWKVILSNEIKEEYLKILDKGSEMKNDKRSNN